MKINQGNLARLLPSIVWGLAIHSGAGIAWASDSPPSPSAVQLAGLPDPTNKGLVGVGRVPAEAFDRLGDKVDTLGGFFSSMVIDPASLQAVDGTFSGTVFGVTDRGWSLGGGAITFDYHPRIQTFNISITPFLGAGPTSQDQIRLVNTASTVFTYDNGKFFTGADSGFLPAPAFPTSLAAGPGKGRRSLDSEGLARANDGTWFVSDEYGALLHHFSDTGELLGSFFPPEAYLPKTGNYPATLNWTGVAAPASGRRNNRGFEGVTLTPDGKRAVAILQSPLVQDGGRSASSQNSRILEFDVESGSATYGQPVAEYVYQTTLKGNAAGDRGTILSDILALGRERFLVIERDSLGYGSGDTNPPVYKRIVLISTSGATNIINTGYDLERGAPGMVALPTNALPTSVAAVSRFDLVDLIQEAQISKFGLNNLSKDINSIPEKWEGLGLIPLKDADQPDDYLLLVGTDNDLTAPVVYHNGVSLATNAAPIDTLVQAWHITLPGVGEAAPANATPGIVFTGPNNPTLSAPARVDLTTSAYDQDGKIMKVEFYEGDTKIGEDSTFPFSLRLEGVPTGTHVYRAVCRDNSGATAERSKSVVVTAENLAPLVSLSAPAGNSYVAAGASAKLSVKTSDPDGFVSKVEYFLGNTSLGTVSAAPFDLTAPSLPTGSQIVLAVATDNQGASTQSAPITLHVLPSKVVSPVTTVAGAKFSDWSARWWQWAISQTFNDEHPLKDEVGAQAYRGQSGNVWFLGGAVNASGTVTRKVVVPAGKYLYLPLVNAECSSVEAPPYAGGDTQVTLGACAQKFEKTDLYFTLDGTSVPGLSGNRVISSLFSFKAPEPNLLGVPGPIQGVGVDDGYYVMLEPLNPGQHTLQFGGKFVYAAPDPKDSFTFTQTITYEVTILPPGVVPQSQLVAGKSYGEWAAEWYRWDLGNATNRAASLDATGANGHNGQKGPVWFLAGSTVGGTIDRTVVVPKDKNVFFPVINIINDFPCPDPDFKPAEGQSMEAFLSEFAKAVVDTTVGFQVEIDGVVTTNPLPYRARSGLFEFTADATWAGIDSCTTQRPVALGVADGYWIMLEPLTSGAHTIRFKAKDFIPGRDAQGNSTLTPFGDQDITYHITVPPAGVVPPYVEVAGKNQAEWSAAWWQWALSQGTNTSPLLDTTGASAGVRQSGDVYFISGLLGYSNGSYTANRTFTVPAGKSLFFPVLNGVADNIDVVPPVSEAQLREWATGFAQGATGLFATVDGQSVTGITSYRQKSPSSAVVLPASNVFQPLSPGYQDGVVIEDQVSDGYWIMVSPLPPGDHIIAFGGKNEAGFSLAVTNRIKVAAPAIVPPGDTYLGKTYGQWGRDWWTWATKIPYAQSPLFDTSGSFGHLGQSGDVWFLAGTSGASVERSLVIPNGKSLFVPLINLGNDYPCPDPNFKPAEGQSLSDFLTQGAADFLAGTTNLFAQVDGVTVTNLFSYRGTSGLFSFTADISLKDPWDGCITGSEQQAVTDGYWLMLKPLTAGTHTLHIGGGHTAFGVDVTYHLTVLPAGVYPPYTDVAGKSQADHTAHWWIWASEQTRSSNPLKDTTGHDANNQQPGDVFYLGGTFGSTDDPTVPAATRHYRIPGGKPIFFPLLNGENDNATYEPDVSFGQLRSDLKDVMDGPLKLVASIDGQPIPNPAALRQVSGEFGFTLPLDNIYHPLDPRYVDGARLEPAVSDGYWVMLEPLSAGTHVIDYGGKVRNGFSTAVRAIITVVPERFSFISRVDSQGGNVRINYWTASGGVDQQVETASEVGGPWQTVGAAVAGDGRQHELIQPLDAFHRFFRVRSSAP